MFVLQVKGYQVSPVEIKNILKKHSAIIDAAVVGITDTKTGEALKAFLVFIQGHTVSADNIIHFVKERVAE